MLPPEFLVHVLTVEPQTGEGGLGEVYGPPVPVEGLLDYRRQLVRNSTGAEVVSESTFLTDLERAPLFAPDSRVELPDGSSTYVLAALKRDDGGLTGLAHLEVTLR